MWQQWHLIAGGVDVAHGCRQSGLVLRLKNHVHHFQLRASIYVLWHYSPDFGVCAGEETSTCEGASFRKYLSLCEQHKQLDEQEWTSDRSFIYLIHFVVITLTKDIFTF
jgi:hypothetical protein